MASPNPHNTNSSQAQALTAMTLDTYRFPTHRLQLRDVEPGKTPLVLVACGSFSPTTYLHLRMFSLAYDYVKANTNFQVVGAYLSPVSDAYKKVGLAPADHRIRMGDLAVQRRTQTAATLMVDPWEAIHAEYMPTAKVLDHFEHELNDVLGGVEDTNGVKHPVRIALLAGADLIQTMGTPGVWTQEDLGHILGKYGAFVIERAGTDFQEAIGSLKEWENNIYYIPQTVANDVSSTRVRLLSKRRMNIDYLVPTEVVDYINQHGLYQEDDGTVTGKLKGTAS